VRDDNSFFYRFSGGFFDIQGDWGTAWLTFLATSSTHTRHFIVAHVEPSSLALHGIL
jgi:hypothetical protein